MTQNLSIRKKSDKQPILTACEELAELAFMFVEFKKKIVHVLCKNIHMCVFMCICECVHIHMYAYVNV